MGQLKGEHSVMVPSQLVTAERVTSHHLPTKHLPWNRVCDTKITLHYEFLKESILFGFQMNGEVFEILNYCILNGKFYVDKQKLFHENALHFYDYLWELKYKLQIERMICNGTSNDEQFSKFLFIYNAWQHICNIVMLFFCNKINFAKNKSKKKRRRNPSN